MTPPGPQPAGLREVPGPRERLWVEIDDGDPYGRTVYHFDLTWLTSSWTCIFGGGCPGIDSSRPDAGCCVHGAWFSEPADEERVALAVARLDRSGWANADHPVHGADGEWAETDPDGDRRTAVVDGACVFHNPRGFPGGYGCALHALALREGVPPLTTKPDVCWQLPVRRTYDTVADPDGGEHLQVTVTEYTRAGWGGGGADFDWYCTTSPAAHTGAVPVWRSLREELVELVGEEVYARLDAHCTALVPPAGARRLLPLTVHPATAAAQAPVEAPGPGRRPVD
ncbi:hypothetical protein [Aquipuribacter hungaricus]|uniref:DUF3109 family protein n=1 Tax=Aquipuribacter hungaricus TaxID=545624 RepID=A0ABV7WNQ1_9MICO